MATHPRFLLIAMIAISVVSDAMLMPFYPQFFEAEFSIIDPLLTGVYLSASCFVVMLAFPVWAAAARHVPVIRLLIYTQFAAGVLCLLCYRSESLAEFWLVSLLMLLFKASYLLIYPYIMSLEHKDKHGSTIGLLAVIVHLGAILGAGVGGFVLELFEPRQVFLLMALGDLAQIVVCFFLLGYAETAIQAPPSQAHPEKTGVPGSIILKLGLMMFTFYFSVFLIRPFFSRYWESISTWNGEIVSGLVFAIPGLMALLALGLKSAGNGNHSMIPAIIWGICGLLLQASQQEAIVLFGRCLFGWALFKAIVRLDLLLFEASSSNSYAADFSKIYFFQSLGVLMASFTAGLIVTTYGLRATFIAAAMGLAVTALLYALLFKIRPKSTKAAIETS